MKPDWKDAPEWAKWLAMDGDGRWYWFEEKPEFCLYGDEDPEDFWTCDGLGRWVLVPFVVAPKDTLEARP